ncbi:MAG: F0F1 ATP synthase subunit delta [Chloroflexi bacterium]|nr:F0F1 ATP synthase subunit delta [Chloroflexota bacterium]
MPARATLSPKRFAQAIFEMAREQGTAEQWEEDLVRISDAVRNEAFVALMDAPGVPMQEKLRAAREVLPDLRLPANHLLGLLAKRRAVELAPAILAEYRRLVDDWRGVARVQLLSAVPLAQGDQEHIAQRLSTILGRQVVLRSLVDPAILGGLIIQVGDRLLDGSVKARLAQMRKTLAEAALG